MPTVSVVIPSYNHEKFVEECIQSILDQTFQDFEIIITDDASTDRTVEIIEKFNDPRIQLFKHTKNRGVGIAINNCIMHASGKYIAWLSSDDIWDPEKLQIQVKYLDEHAEVAVVFGKVTWIDENGNPIKNLPFKNVYDVNNRTRYEWLRNFFYKGNNLSIPCSLVRRECYDEVGMFNPAFANIPDLDFWVRICLRYDIHVLNRKLLKNRWLGNDSNASADSLKNRIRIRFEYRKILGHYLMIENPEEFLLVFPDAAQYGELTTENLPYFLGQVAIATGLDFKVLWGLDVIYHFIKNQTQAQLLEKTCGFTYLDFIKLTGVHDPFRTISVVSQAASEKPRRAWVLFSVSKKYIKDTYLLLLQILQKKSKKYEG